MIRITINKLHIIRAIAVIILGYMFSMCMSFQTFAAETSGSCGENLKWELSGDTLTISGSGDMEDYGEEVVAPWFDMTEQIRKINFPDKLTSIGNYAFYGCSNLTNISIPEQTKEIGQYAFAECTSLLYVDLNSIEILDKGVFQKCSSLSVITFPKTLEEIGTKAFFGCERIQVIEIPETVRYIGSAAFAYCSELVRATVNAPLEQLPVWLFYGCTNLADVSLDSEITSIGQYAFYDCNNLKGIYTQSMDREIADQLEKSMPSDEEGQKKDSVAVHKMSDTSISTTDDGENFTSTTLKQKEDIVVIVKKQKNNSKQSEKYDRVISAVIEDNVGWKSVAEVLDETLESANTDSIVIEIQLSGTTIHAEDLAHFAGKPITLRITTPNGVSWKIDMSEMSADSFSGTYELETSVSPYENKKNKIASEKIEQLHFLGNIDFNVTVGAKVGKANDLATLYVKEGSSYELINTVIIDTEGYAWFSLAGINRHTDYYIGMNVEKITLNSATIPETMYEQYGLENNAAYLMDEEGVQYRITGRSSRWGITGKQFATYVAVAVIAVVLIVGSVMLAFYITKRSKERYERLAEEAALKEQEEEEALRMEIMRELLGEEKHSE